MKKSLSRKLLLASALATTTVIGFAGSSFASSETSLESTPVTENALTAQGTLTYQMNQTSTSIYLNGSVTVTVNTDNVPAGYFIDVMNSNNATVAQKDFDASSSGQKTFTFSGLYGYHKIRVYSEDAPNSTFAVNY